MNMPINIETLLSGSVVEGSLMEFKEGWNLEVNKSVFKILGSIKPSFTNMLSASDAQERHQLTYQYLSLLQANAIEEKDREIILQSLFSRADTGLLKGDSSPTMPDGFMNQILKNIGG